MTAVEDALLLPPGTRLLHIGPHKTGTSSLQSAFHRARRRAAARGVHYAGRNRQPLHAAQVAAAAPSADGNGRDLRPWRALVREIRASRADRVVISSEWFCDAREDAIRRIVDDLDPDRVHVVLTARPLASVMPSQWQQYVQAGMTLEYEPWLRGVLQEPATVTPMFWHRHRHDELAARWADVVGRERVTVVIADDRDHQAVLRAFERLVGLPDGLLEPADERANRSLTRAEIELVRETNLTLNAVELDPRTRQGLVLLGAAAYLKVRRPERDEPRIQTPAWAGKPIARAARSIVEGLRASGVRVVGDLEHLRAPVRSSAARAAGASGTAGERRWPEVAGSGAMGVLLAAGLGRGAAPGLGNEALEPFSTTRLRNILVSRIRRSVAARLPVHRRHAPAGSVDAPPVHSMRAEVE